MVDRVIERTQTETPRDTVVVHDDQHDRGTNTGAIIAVIAVLVLLFLLFGGGLFGGGGGGNDTPGPTNNTNIQTPSAPSTGQ